jgi:hypothetical protein
MNSSALVLVLAAGAGLALLIRSLVRLETRIDQDGEVVVREYGRYSEAQDAQDALEAAGIPSILRRRGYRVGSTCVVVNRDQARAAQRILTAQTENC